MKISLASLTSGFLNLLSLNANFSAIQDDLNDKVLYRDPPVGEPNHMSAELDMDSNDIVNVNQLRTTDLFIGGTQVVPGDVATVGLSSFPVGLEAVPGLYVATDEDTGLYAPATNQLAVTAGGTLAQTWTSAGASIPGTLGVTGTSTLGVLQVGAITGTSFSGTSVSVTGAVVGNSITITSTVSLPAFTIATGSVATTAAANDNSTKLATTEYVDTAVAAIGALPGSIVQSVYTSNTANTAIVADTPVDGTPPLVSEGTQVLSTSITPTSATNKIRCRASVPYSISSDSGGSRTGSVHMHKGSDSAMAARRVAVGSAAYLGNIQGDVILEAEFVAGATSPITISVRAGKGAGTMVVCASAQFGTGVNIATLVLEEIAV